MTAFVQATKHGACETPIEITGIANVQAVLPWFPRVTSHQKTESALETVREDNSGKSRQRCIRTSADLRESLARI